MVVIKFTFVNMVRSLSFDKRKVKQNITKETTPKISGMLLVLENEIPQTITPKKNKAGNKNPAKVPFLFPPTDMYKKSFNQVDKEICHLLQNSVIEAD